jgi:hypothetical protein
MLSPSSREPVQNERLNILRSLVHLGGKAHELANELRAAGFCAFVPYQRFIDSFARDAAELETHKACVIESARWYMGNSDPSLGPTYQSQLLGQLLQDAKRSFMASDPSTAWITDHFPDPCEQAAKLASVRSPKDYDRRESAMREQCANQRLIESERHARLAPTARPLRMLLKTRRFSFAKEVLSAHKHLSVFSPQR